MRLLWQSTAVEATSTKPPFHKEGGIMSKHLKNVLLNRDGLSNRRPSLSHRLKLLDGVEQRRVCLKGIQYCIKILHEH